MSAVCLGDEASSWIGPVGLVWHLLARGHSISVSQFSVSGMGHRMYRCECGRMWAR